MPQEWYGNEPDLVEFMEFISSKTKKTTTQMNLMQLCRDFHSETNSRTSVAMLRRKIDRCRPKIHLMNQFDRKTKVRLLFGLSAIVDKDYLTKLKSNANVRLDSRGRIIKYERHDGSLILYAKGYSEDPQYYREREEKMFIFLAKKSRNATIPLTEAVFFEEFRSKYGYHDPDDRLNGTYQSAKMKIFTSTQFDKETRIRMLFMSKAVVPQHVVDELRKSAIVNLDEMSRISEYIAADGSLELKQPEVTGSRTQPLASSSALGISPNEGSTSEMYHVANEEPVDEPQNVQESTAGSSSQSCLYVMSTDQPVQPNHAERTQQMFLTRDPSIKAEPSNQVGVFQGRSMPMVTPSFMQILSNNIRPIIPPVSKGSLYAQTMDVLKWLNFVIMTFKSPEFVPLRDKIGRAVAANKSELIPIDSIINALTSSLHILAKVATTENDPNRLVSISRFLEIIRSALQGFEHPSLFNLLHGIEAFQRDYHHKNFSIQFIRPILETIFILSS